MDSSNWISGSVGFSITFFMALLYKLYQNINHHRIRSNCCGKLLVASVDIEETTPQRPDLHIKTPPNQNALPP
jgi:hypothetical protein